MKFKFMLLILALTTLGVAPAHAVYTCSIGPCGDGTSCSASGSSYATCTCSVWWSGNDTARCSSGLIVVPHGNPTGLNPRAFTATEMSDLQVYEVTPLD